MGRGSVLLFLAVHDCFLLLASCRVQYLLKRGPFASQTELTCSYQVLVPSLESFLLYFDEIKSKGPSREAQPLSELSLVLLTLDAMLSKGVPLFDLGSPSRIYVSVVFVAASALVILIFLALELRASLLLHQLATPNGLK